MYYKQQANLENQRQRAFSLLELLVVLAIVAVVMTLGISGLVDLRNRTLLKQAVDNLIQNFNTVRNSARNSVIDKTTLAGGTPEEIDNQVLEQASQSEYYAMVFNNDLSKGDYYKGTCQSAGSTNYNCSFDVSQPLKGGAYEQVKVQSPSGTCDTIIFNLGRGNIGFLTTNGTDGQQGNGGIRVRSAIASGATKCELEFSLKNNTNFKLVATLDKTSYDFALK